MRAALRMAVVAAGLLAAWQAVVSATGAQPFILPGPLAVAAALAKHGGLLLPHAGTTLAEILLGLGLGAALGAFSALAIAYVRPARLWLLPVLVASQAVPVFAIAPVLVLWLGYGMASKVAMAVLIIFFPVTAAFYDGLPARTRAGSTSRAAWARRAGASFSTCAFQPPCRPAPPACASPRRSRPSAPWSGSGSALRPASATSCCTPMRACRWT